MMTSTRAQSAATRASCARSFRFATRLRFPRLSEAKLRLNAWPAAFFTMGGHARRPSPSGASTLTTSAPRSASSMPQNGAAAMCPNSSTRRPSSNPPLIGPPRSRLRRSAAPGGGAIRARGGPSHSCRWLVGARRVFNDARVRGYTMRAVQQERTCGDAVALEQHDEFAFAEAAFDDANRIVRRRGADELQLAVVLIRPEERNRRTRLRGARRCEKRPCGEVALRDRVVDVLYA